MALLQFERNNDAAQFIASAYNHEPKAYVQTFGCQQNVNDSEQLKGVLSNAGFLISDKAQDADLIVFNTCAVREHAEQRIFGNIGALKQLKEANPRLVIAICGCMVQQKHIVTKLKKSYPYVDIVLGVNRIGTLPGLVAEKISTKKRKFEALGDVPDIIEGMPIKRDNEFRAWLPIMYGCDNFCSFCIVPYVRGRERSRTSEDVLNEFKQLLKDGYKDITLLGQNVNSYGKGLEGKKIDFSDLLKMLDDIEGDFRIRFMTSHPKDATRKLIDTIAEGKHICHHLHLPVQSGADDILRQMNRRYNSQDYMSLINYAKQKVPDMTFSSDIIVGFPGETEEDFEKTLNLVKEVGYAQLFTFIYSKRSGTKAAEMPDNITRIEKAQRIDTIIKLQEKITAEHTSAFIGTVHKVLVEGVGRDEELLTGRMDNNMAVDFKADKKIIGKFIDVKITGAKGAVLKGEIC